MANINRGFRIAAHIILIFIAICSAMPFILLLVSSITQENTLIEFGYSFIPRKLDFSAYYYLFSSSGSIVNAYMMSALVTVTGTVINLFLSTLFAYPLSRKDLPGRNVFAFFLYFTMLFNGGLVPTYIMWTQLFHVKDTIWALIFPGLLLQAFNVIMMRTYFRANIPDAVTEAATIDGASEFRILVQIIVPMSTPILATLTLFAGLGYWNDWINGLYYLTNDRLYTIQVYLSVLLRSLDSMKANAAVGAIGPMPSTAMRMAVAVMGVLPVLIVFPFFQKYFVKGITIGAIKG